MRGCPTERSGGVLRARERALLDAVTGALLPGSDPALPSARQAGVVEAVDGLLSTRVDPDLVAVVRAVLWGLEAAAVATRGRTFVALDREGRTGLLGAVSRTRLAPAVDLLKHLVVNTHLSQPSVAAAIGYDPGAAVSAVASRGQVPQPASCGPPRRLEPLTWPDVPPELRADVVVVGSGAGGAPVAALLAEAGLDVLVLEEGPYRTGTDLAGQPPFERLARLYRDLAVTGTIGRPAIPVPVGRAVGGTTVVNAGTCLRAPDAVLARWVLDHGLDDAGPADLAPIFAEVEAVQGVALPPDRALGANAAVVRAAAQAVCGRPGRPLARNVRGCRGCGESVVGCPHDAKQGVHLTWLPRAERAGARIVAGARVDRVVHHAGHREPGRARGVAVSLLDDGPCPTVRGRCVVRAPLVVVAAGALHTPTLLDRSRVPDPSRQRGRNLQLHPAIGVAAEMPEPVEAWRGVLQSWVVDELQEEHGILVEATSAPPPITGGQMPFVGAPLEDLLLAARRTATCGFLIEDSTTGRVRRGPRGRSLATYQLTDHDRRRIATGFAWVAEAFLAAGATRVLVGDRDRPWATRRADLERIRDHGVPVEALKLSAYHPVGTHRVSADPRLGPSDPWGAVRGTDGLWVADASLLPTCLGVNPQITVMAFAVRAARRMLATI